MGEGEGEGVDACHVLSTDACGCMSWDSFEELAARSVVVQQQSTLPTGEAGAWFGSGLVFALLVCWVFR